MVENKRMKLNKFITLIGVLLLLLISQATIAAQNLSCDNAKAEFRKLYIALQNSLNYDGKDAVLDKGILKLVAHTGKDYEGKLFEDNLFREYQNSLTKVAKVYQVSKKAGNEDLKSNPDLVDFFKALDTKTSMDFGKFDKILDGLKKSSEVKNTSESDKQFIINDNDIYLLKNLLIHAQDRICRTEKYASKSKKVDELENLKNAPLNRMLNALQNGNISADSDLNLVKTDTVIKSAVNNQMENLRKWMKDLNNSNPNCFKAIKNDPAFIQNGIQSCNYKKFVDSLILDNSSVTNLESVLHFINSNQKHGKVSPLAETGIDKLKLEAFIDQTFKNLNDKISCSEVTGEKYKKIFIRNLPYSNNKFDISKIKCKVGDKDVEGRDCAVGIELVSDELGRGVEVRRTTGSKVTSFSYEGDSPSCKDQKFSNVVIFR